MKNASKKFLFIALMVVVTLSLSGIAISARTATSEVRENALNKAIEQAGVNADEIYDVEIEVERKKGVEIVEVEFEAKGKDYEYHINKETGEIIDSKVKNDKYLTPDTATDTEISEKDKISKEAALQIAFTESGYNVADVRDLEVDLDKQKGSYYYEVDFEVTENGTEIDYEYDIDAYTGEILNKKVKEDKSAVAAVTPKNPSGPTAPVASSEPNKPAASADEKTVEYTKPAEDRIAKEAALAIAIKDAGINEADVRDLDIELDKEREIFVYEIDFETYNNRQEIEYEYDINAATGEIIKKEIERDG